MRSTRGTDDTFDYVIVGAGSAGCVLAARLSEDPAVSVCLLEAGDRDKSLLLHVPLGIAVVVPWPIHNWGFRTVPQAGLDGRRGYQPRGKTLGGSSSINAMIYTRGHRNDYDEWAALGNTGWSYADVLPYFRRAENNERLADGFHGRGGPLNVADPRSPSGFSELWLAAAEDQGLRRNADFNGAEQEGIGYYQLTQKGGERWSAARAYLAPNLERTNLDVRTRAHATRVIFDGRRAVGVDYRHGDAGVRSVRARRETILSGGALQSPQLLLLSGVGDAEALRALGIPVVADLPQVGRNLRDHVDFVIAYQSPRKDLIGFMPGDIVNAFRSALRYRRERRGIFTSNVAEAGGFLKTSPELAAPDIQLHFCIGILESHGRKLHARRGFSTHVCVLRPQSAGALTLARQRSVGRAADRSRLLRESGRSRDDGEGLPDRAPNLAIAAARSVSRQGDVHRGCRVRRRDTRGPQAPFRHDLSSRRHVPDGRRRGSLSSIRSFACAASRRCEWSTRRSCPRSSAATRTRRRS
jgi:choline dehydrogenase-like flavoprotein